MNKTNNTYKNMATKTIGECLCTICGKLNALDAKVSALDTQEIVNKLDIIFAGGVQTQKKVDTILEEIDCNCEECVIDPTPASEVTEEIETNV